MFFGNGGLWVANPLTGQIVRSRHTGASTVWAGALSRDLTRAAVSDQVGHVHVVDSATGNRLRTFTGFTGTYNKPFFTESGGVLAILDSGLGRVKSFDLNTGALVSDFTALRGGRSIWITTKDSELVASNSSETNVYSLQTGALLRKLSNRADCIGTIVGTQPGRLLNLYSQDSPSARLVRASDGTELADQPREGSPKAITYFNNGQFLAQVSQRGPVLIKKATDGAVVATLDNVWGTWPSSYPEVCVSPDDRYIAATFGTTLRVYDLAGNLPKWERAFPQGVYSPQFAPGSAMLLYLKDSRVMSLTQGIWQEQMVNAGPFADIQVAGDKVLAKDSQSVYQGNLQFGRFLPVLSFANSFLMQLSHDGTVLFVARAGALEAYGTSDFGLLGSLAVNKQEDPCAVAALSSRGRCVLETTDVVSREVKVYDCDVITGKSLLVLRYPSPYGDMFRLKGNPTADTFVFANSGTYSGEYRIHN